MDVLLIRKEIEKLSNEVLLLEFDKHMKFKKVHMYLEMAKRAECHPMIKERLLQEISAKENMSKIFFNFIKMPWVVMINILEHGGDMTKKEAKILFRQWPQKEQVSFMEYINREKEYVDYLKLSD